MLVSASHEEGVLEAEEQEMLHKVFDFAETQVDDVMVPRPDVIALPVTLTPAEAVARVLEQPYTRYPVYDEDLDDVCGVLHLRRLFDAMQNGAAQRARPARAGAPGLLRARDEEARQPAGRVPPHQHAPRGRRRRVRLDGGHRHARGPAGGDRRRHRRRVRPARRARSCGWARTASASRARIPSRSSTSASAARLPEEDYNSLGGFVFGELGRAAEPGDRVRYDGCVFRVHATDGPRILSIDVELKARPESERRRRPGPRRGRPPTEASAG